MADQENFFNDFVKDNSALFDYDLDLIEKHKKEVYRCFLSCIEDGLNPWDAVETAVAKTEKSCHSRLEVM